MTSGIARAADAARMVELKARHEAHRNAVLTAFQSWRNGTHGLMGRFRRGL